MMEFTQPLQPGLAVEESILVEEAHLARHIGSGSARVLATPYLIAFMERVSHRFLVRFLPPGYSSVGTMIEMRHLAPTPVGSTVRVRSEVLEVNGNRVLFAVAAWDEQEKIGEGRHERVIIEESRFLRRVQSKAGGAEV